MKSRIIPQENPFKEIENLEKSYSFYTDLPVIIIEEENELLIKIPMLNDQVAELV